MTTPPTGRLVPQRFARNDIVALSSVPMKFDLAESVGPDLLLGELLADGQGPDLAELALSYGSPTGNEDLRALIAADHGVAADRVITLAGGMQALFLSAFILGGPGDDVVVSTPLFPNTRVALEAVGANVITFPARFDDGYRVDPQVLRSHLTPTTKLVSIASPQNPSGVALTTAETAEILAVMDQTCPDAFLLIDETYRQATYGTEDTIKSHACIDDRVIVCSSLSKCHGAPGARTGWLISSNDNVLDQVAIGKFNTTISNSLVDDAVAIWVLQNSKRILASRRVLLQEGLDRTAAFVAANSDLVDWVRPDAGALCCLRLKDGAIDDASVRRFYDELAVREVRVGNGSWFGEPDRVFRLGFGHLGLDDLDEALVRLAAALRAANDY